LSGDDALNSESISATGSVMMGWLRQAQEALKRDVPLEEVERLLGTGSMVCLQYGIRVKTPNGYHDEDLVNHDSDAVALSLSDYGLASEATQESKERGLWDCVEAVTEYVEKYASPSNESDEDDSTMKRARLPPQRDRHRKDRSGRGCKERGQSGVRSSSRKRRHSQKWEDATEMLRSRSGPGSSPQEAPDTEDAGGLLVDFIASIRAREGAHL